ncbi:ABC transporter ATP-binding protein [Ktedonobacteria bacterium brp13]|nr:ABC transporter ATP-binding protein [Ktedonobacteria bacterium brp13]
MADNLLTMQQINTPSTLSNETVLRVEHLTKIYGERRAVDNLDFEVRRGDIFGFLGPNGAGKTTTVRMIFGLITPTSGSINILGYAMPTHRAQVLPYVGALIETPALYRHLSGRDNLRAIGYGLGGVSEKRMDAVLDLVGLGTRAKDRVRTYSLGMKQRLAIAIALLHDPKLIILDEPANGLDPAGIVEMRDLMHRLSAEGKTVLISSHMLNEVQQICTRVAIVNQGKLITVAAVDELLGGTDVFLVKLERAAEALALVKAQSWGARASLNAQGDLVTPAPNGRGQDLNAFLGRAGFIAAGLAQANQDLEQVFLHLTNSMAGDK